jgi:hypothetical protein
MKQSALRLLKVKKVTLCERRGFRNARRSSKAISAALTAYPRRSALTDVIHQAAQTAVLHQFALTPTRDNSSCVHEQDERDNSWFP